jgi:hypothetical protein
MANLSKFSTSEFVNSSRNRLILIVSLFALVCFFVGIAATSEALETMQRWILIAFIVLFSTIGLSLSVWLVLRQARQNAVREDNREFGWKASSTDSQRRKLNDNLREITIAMKNPDVPIGDLFSAYIVAEDLALRQIEQESNDTLLRHQSVGSADFDAVLFKHDVIVCVEIAFLIAPDISQAKINEVLKKIASAKRTFERLGKSPKFRLLLVLITQLDSAGETELRSSLVKKFSATPVEVDVRLFDFESLQKIYADD